MQLMSIEGGGRCNSSNGSVEWKWNPRWLVTGSARPRTIAARSDLPSKGGSEQPFYGTRILEDIFKSVPK